METVEAHREDGSRAQEQWGAKLDALVARPTPAGTEAKIDYRKRLDDAERDTRPRRPAHRAPGCRQQQMGHVQGGVESAWSDLESAFTKLTN